MPFTYVPKRNDILSKAEQNNQGSDYRQIAFEMPNFYLCKLLWLADGWSKRSIKSHPIGLAFSFKSMVWGRKVKEAATMMKMIGRPNQVNRYEPPCWISVWKWALWSFWFILAYSIKSDTHTHTSIISFLGSSIFFFSFNYGSSIKIVQRKICAVVCIVCVCVCSFSLAVIFGLSDVFAFHIVYMWYMIPTTDEKDKMKIMWKFV